VDAGYRILIDQALSRLVGRVGSFEYRPENIGRRRKAGRDATTAAPETPGMGAAAGASIPDKPLN
jgi:hypothetical protein